MTADALLERIAELGPWFQPFTLAGWNTWEVAPHPVYTPDPLRAQIRWRCVAAMLPDRLDGWRVLDVGCNEGYMATELARLGADVDAIDAFAPVIERAQLVADILESGVKPQVADFYDVEGEFDLVLMANVLSMLRDPLLALRRAAVLSPRLLVHCALERPAATEPSSLWTPSRAELEEALRGAGYSTLRRGDPGDPLSAIYLAEEIRAEVF